MTTANVLSPFLTSYIALGLLYMLISRKSINVGNIFSKYSPSLTPRTQFVTFTRLIIVLGTCTSRKSVAQGEYESSWMLE